MIHRTYTAPLFGTLFAGYAALFWFRRRRGSSVRGELAQLARTPDDLTRCVRHEGDLELGAPQATVRYRIPIATGHWGWALSTLESAALTLPEQGLPSPTPKAWKRDLSALMVLAVAILQARFR